MTITSVLYATDLVLQSRPLWEQIASTWWQAANDEMHTSRCLSLDPSQLLALFLEIVELDGMNSQRRFTLLPFLLQDVFHSSVKKIGRQSVDVLYFLWCGGWFFFLVPIV